MTGTASQLNRLVPSLDMYIETLRLDKPAVIRLEVFSRRIIPWKREVKVANETWDQLRHFQHRDVAPNAGSSTHTKLRVLLAA